MNNLIRQPYSRRGLIRGLTLSAAVLSAKGAFAEALTPTARLTEGPYYPDKMPLDTDNDLLIVNDAITPAVGEITHLSGRVLSAAGEPVRNAFVEIWQVDNRASYIHSRGRNPGGYDSNFQGYGRFLTDVRGQYYFRTIKPVPYVLGGMGRAPHIHVAISKNGHRLLTTQILIRGHEANARDGVFQELRDPSARETVLTDFKPIPGSKLGELAANFDVIFNRTVQEGDDGKLAGGIGKSEGGGPGGPGGPGRGPGFGPPPPFRKR
jgi:protocatechuate 3,4-dioxygenase beta subunit